MQKVKKSKQKISAVLLSIIMAFSLIIVPSAKKVYASGDSVDNFTKWTLAQVLANDNRGTYFNDGEKPDLKTAIIYEAKKQDQGSTMYFGDFYSSLTDDFKENIFTEEEVKDTLKTMDSQFISYDDTTSPETVKIEYAGGGDELNCNMIGTVWNDDSKTTTVYGHWVNYEDSSYKGDYVAVTFDGDRLISYRKVEDKDVQVGFEAYGYDYEKDDEINYMRTKDGKSVAVIPFWSSAECRPSIKIEGKDVDNDLEMVLSKDPNEEIIMLDKDDNDEYQIYTYNEPKNNDPESIICEYKDDNGTVVLKGTVPCYVLKMSIRDMFSGYGIYVEPGETSTLKARISGYPTDGLTYKWESKEFSDVDGKTTESIQFNAPAQAATGNIKLSVYTDQGELLVTDSEEVTVGKCSISFNAIDLKTGKIYSKNANLQLKQSYIFAMNGANFGWAVNNSGDEFEKWTFTQNGKTLTIGYDDKITGDKSFVDINGDVGGAGVPHEMVVFKKAGKVTITGTIKRNGKEFRSGSTTFNIAKANQTITASSPTKTYSTKKQTVNLNAKVNDKAALSYKSDNKNITVDSKGKVTIKAKYVGAANITITSKETANYKAGKKVVKVTVNPSKTTLSSVKNTKSKTMTVKWKKNTVGSGYQIEYATNKKFTGKKTVKISKNKTTSTTVKKLKKKSTYYVRIRTYKTVSKKTYYSSWSSVKSVKITK